MQRNFWFFLSSSHDNFRSGKNGTPKRYWVFSRFKPEVMRSTVPPFWFSNGNGKPIPFTANSRNFPKEALLFFTTLFFGFGASAFFGDSRNRVTGWFEDLFCKNRILRKFENSNLQLKGAIHFFFMEEKINHYFIKEVRFKNTILPMAPIFFSLEKVFSWKIFWNFCNSFNNITIVA